MYFQSLRTIGLSKKASSITLVDQNDLRNILLRGEGGSSVVISLKVSHSKMVHFGHNRICVRMRKTKENSALEVERSLRYRDIIADECGLAQIYMPRALMVSMNTQYCTGLLEAAGCSDDVINLILSFSSDGQYHFAAFEDLCYLPDFHADIIGCGVDVHADSHLCSLDKTAQYSNDNNVFATVTVELKPKCGFPDSPITAGKTSSSEFVTLKHCLSCNTQVLKHSESGRIAKSAFCPMRLFSEDAELVCDTIKQLLVSQSNFLRIFINGELVFGLSYGGEKSTDVKEQRECQGLKRVLEVIGCDQTQFTQFLTDVLLNRLDSESNEESNEENGGILRSLKSAQKQCYVHSAIAADVYSRCQRLRLPKKLITFPELVDPPRVCTPEEEILRRFTLFATLCDCSILMSFRCNLNAKVDNIANSADGIRHSTMTDSDELEALDRNSAEKRLQNVDYSTVRLRIIDTDEKPIERVLCWRDRILRGYELNRDVPSSDSCF